AGRSATAAKEIKELIEDSGKKVEEGKQLVNRSGESLTNIVSSVKEVSDLVAEIASASEEQSQGITEVNKAVARMDEMTQQNAALVEEVASSSDAMGNLAVQLEDVVSFFKIDDEDVMNSDIARSITGGNGGSMSARQPQAAPNRSTPSTGKTDSWEEF
ncbi:MAG: chemotaxis protein, partial [Sinobacterium sp.]|nr:chemotaxis protein [Sinobacterium sp.]